jgi:D-aminopeptidase
MAGKRTDEVLVSDSHWVMRNLLLKQLDGSYDGAGPYG